MPHRRVVQVKPTHVLNCAGLTGRPNVDWCEDHKVCGCCRLVHPQRSLSDNTTLRQIETIRVNVLGMLNLADICLQKNVHLTTYATGCIFHYDKDFPENSGKGFKEDDTPNFTGSYYSYTKVLRQCMHLLTAAGPAVNLLARELRHGTAHEPGVLTERRLSRQWWRAC